MTGHVAGIEPQFLTQRPTIRMGRINPRTTRRIMRLDLEPAAVYVRTQVTSGASRASKKKADDDKGEIQGEDVAGGPDIIGGHGAHRAISIDPGSR